MTGDFAGEGTGNFTEEGGDGTGWVEPILGGEGSVLGERAGVFETLLLAGVSGFSNPSKLFQLLSFVVKGDFEFEYSVLESTMGLNDWEFLVRGDNDGDVGMSIFGIVL